MRNILEDWKKNVRFASSSLNPNRSLQIINDLSIESICHDLVKWFGSEVFEIETKEIDQIGPGDIVNQNWLIYMLSAKNTKAIQAVIEFWKVLSYHDKVDSNRIAHLANFLAKRKYRQFRDYYFELFSFFVFEANGIQNEFKVFEGNNELEGIVNIEGESCLVECRKLYYNKYENLQMNSDLMQKIIRYVHKNPVGLIIAVEYDRVNKNLIDKVIKTISKQVDKWLYREPNTFYMPFTQTIENQIKIRIELFSPDRFDDMKQSFERDNYLLAQTEPIKMTDGTNRTYLKLRLDNRVSATDQESQKRFLKAITEKRKKRATSQFGHRIYFFESENYPGFDRGLFILNGFDQNVQTEIQEFLDRKSTSDVVVLIMKESNPVEFPRVRKFILANERAQKIISKLEKMEFQLN